MTQIKTNIERLQQHYTVARKRLGPIKRFTAIGREELKVEWFCKGGIYRKYHEDFYRFLDAFFGNPESAYYIETIFVNEGITDYEERIQNFADSCDKNLSLKNEVTPVVVKPSTGKTRPHAAFKKVAMLAKIERQVFISGPAGTGKTTLGDQIAENFGLEFGHISCTAGMSEAHLLGRMDAHGNYLESLFVKIFENGGVFLFDEVDAADPNTMLIINSALANGYLSIPNRIDNPKAKRHENFYCICAANTWGSGSNQYVGRNILDAAFLDRFVASRVFVDYDKKLEREIAAGKEKALEVIWKIRDNVVKHRLQRLVSTRAIVSAVKQINAGIEFKDFLETFFTGWTKEEIAKAKEGVDLTTPTSTSNDDLISALQDAAKAAVTAAKAFDKAAEGLDEEEEF